MALPLAGRNAKIEYRLIGGSSYLELKNATNWDLDISAEELDATSFGSTWGATVQGFKRWTATLTINYSTDSGDNQQSLINTLINAANLSGLKLYVDSSNNKHWLAQGSTNNDPVATVTRVSVRAGKGDLITATINVVGQSSISFQ